MSADPYRNAPIVMRASDPPGPRGVIHPFAEPEGRHPKGGAVVSICRWCHVVIPPRREFRCHGRRRFVWFGAWLCPRRAHHHVNCVHCGRDWLEATCDEAPREEL